MRIPAHLLRRAILPSAPILLIIMLADETVELMEMLSVEAFLMLNKLRFGFPPRPSRGSKRDGAKLELLGRRLPSPAGVGGWGGVTGGEVDRVVVEVDPRESFAW